MPRKKNTPAPAPTFKPDRHAQNRMVRLDDATHAQLAELAAASRRPLAWELRALIGDAHARLKSREGGERSG